MPNYAFDFAASITSDLPFGQLTCAQLVTAMRERLEVVEANNELEAFGWYDTCDEEEEEEDNETETTLDHD